MRLIISLACSLILGSIVVAQSLPDPRVLAAQKRVSTDPKSFQAYNELAFALCRKARDSDETVLYGKAETALHRSLELSPANYDARKLQVTVMLGQHKFADGLQLASDLNSHVPDDIAVWGLLVDVNIALGNYEAAERAAQWILDLRPGSALGFEKAAALREVFGDGQGAAEFLDEAGRRTSQNDLDQSAWLLTQKARLALAAGNPKQATELLNEVVKLFPDSQLALAGFAQARLADGRYPEAASLFEKRYRAVPNTENLYDWADALERAGRKEEALALFKRFEIEARAKSTHPDPGNLKLVSFYADRKGDFSEALSLAGKEAAARHDSATLDAYAWALFRSGKFAEANTQITKALAVGIRNSAYFCHASRIAAGADDAASAARFEKELTGMPAGFCPTERSLQAATKAPQ